MILSRVEANSRKRNQAHASAIERRAPEHARQTQGAKHFIGTHQRDQAVID